MKILANLVNVWSFNKLHLFKKLFLVCIRYCSGWLTQIYVEYYFTSSWWWDLGITRNLLGIEKWQKTEVICARKSTVLKISFEGSEQDREWRGLYREGVLGMCGNRTVTMDDPNHEVTKGPVGLRAQVKSMFPQLTNGNDRGCRVALVLRNPQKQLF